MKKWSYLLAASVLSGVLFASSPAAVFAGGTGGSSGSGTVSTEQAAGSQTGGNSSGTDENAAAGTNGAESSGAEGSSGTAGGNGTVSGNDAAGENGAAGGNGTAGENDAAGGAAEAQEPYMGYIRGTEGYPTDVPDSSWQKIGTEPENTDAYAVKTVEDGTYVITMASNGFKALGSSSSGGTVRLGDADGGSGQRFRVTWNDSENDYTIQSDDGSYLATADGYQVLYSNICKSSSAEGWYLVPDGQGHYNVIAKKSGMAVEIASGSLANGSGACLAARSGAAAQKFDFVKAADCEAPGEGYYELASASDLSSVIDIEAGSISPGANVRIIGANGTDAQKFALRNAGNGAYTMMSVSSGMFVEAAGTASGSNVRQAVKSGGAAQRWIIKAVGDGTYYLRSAADSSKALTISGGNIQLGDSSGQSSQKFVLKKTAFSQPTGIYFIASAANTGYVLDVYSGSRKMQANVQLFAKNGGNWQKFEIIDRGYGYVAIRNVQSKHMLDVAGGGRGDGVNIWQYRDNGGDAQLFAVHKNGDGTYTFVNAGSGKAIDAAGGIAANGTNIQQYTCNGSVAQRFVLQATSGSDGTPIDYSVYEPPKPLVDAVDRKAQGYSSASGYEILVNRSNHTVSVYTGSKGNWRRVKRFACGDGKASTPTVEGVFAVINRQKSFGSGFTCWYATRFYGHYLFHSVLYYPGSMTRVMDGRLGMGVSHGCVRLAIENAKWIYDNIPNNTRVVVYH